jgi:hypothetical protein
MPDYDVALQTARMQEIIDALGAGANALCYFGAVPTNVGDLATGTLFATLPMSNPVGVAASGVLTFNPFTAAAAVAGAADTPSYVRLQDSGANDEVQLTAGIGSGEVNFNGTVTSGQNADIDDNGTITHF